MSSTGGMESSTARGSKTSKRVAYRKRASLQVASGYVMAWALVWVPSLMHYLIERFETAIIGSLFAPLQGLFNFIVFMSPKVRAAKKPSKRRGQQKEEGELSWYKTIAKSYTSRGERLRQ